MAVHVGVGVLAGVTPTGQAREVASAQPVQMVLLPDPDEVQLGLEQSDAQTEAWLGFREATAHEAMESEVEQSAMTPTPAGGEPAPPMAMPPPTVERVQEASAAEVPPQAMATASEPASELTAEPIPEPLPEPTADPAAEPRDSPEPLPDPLVELVPEPAMEPVPGPQEAPAAALPPSEQAASPTEQEVSPEAPPAEESVAEENPVPPVERPIVPEPADEAQPPAAAPDLPRSTPDDAPEPLPPAPPPSTPVPPGQGGALSGEQSPSESSAASDHTPVEVRLGRVAAAQGLRITTVRPVFSVTTMSLAHPRSPTVVIEFGRDGHVRRASFLPGKATGESGVDQPLLDAVYRWTASGERLEQLPTDPEAVVAITMRIILR